MPKSGDTIVVWFSCGAASAVALQKTIEKYGDMCIIKAVNNPIKEEHSDNIRFLKDVEKWLNIEIESCVNPKFKNHSCEEVWNWKQYMSGIGGASCTKYLKRMARQDWENNNKHDWLVLGFTKEEQRRFDRFKLTERSNILPILIEDDISKQDCYNEIVKAGLKLPFLYLQGYHNANCIGCVKNHSATYWNKIRKEYPEVFKQRCETSRKIGCKLVYYKGDMIFLDELSETAKGRPLRNTYTECGIFCEETK